MRHAVRSKLALAVMALAPIGAAVLASPAAAQTYQYRVAESRQGSINNVSVNSDGGLRPGATLRLQVYATPGARWASVALADDVRVPLRERAPGEYVGTHVIRRGERLDPTRMMTVRAGWGGGPVTMAVSSPPSFQSLAMGAGPAVAAQVSSFALWLRDPDRLEPGQVVHFRLEGTPNARASVDVPGVVRGLQLREDRPGHYEGSYTIRRQDDTDAFSDAVAVLRSGGERVIAHPGGRGGNYGYGYGR